MGGLVRVSSGKDKEPKIKMIEQVWDLAKLKEKFSDAGSTLVVIYFFSKNCELSLSVAPELEKMADQRNDVIFYKVDVENEPGEIDTEFNVSFVPLFVLIINGKRVGQCAGTNTVPDGLTNLINQYVGN